ncbi:hypothetical protein H0O02_00335 [Candidatus Micrarchaeota archaeon]|nr:hypothetical protein [Candidatus Micrarchaeota archaeon]
MKTLCRKILVYSSVIATLAACGTSKRPKTQLQKKQDIMVESDVVGKNKNVLASKFKDGTCIADAGNAKIEYKFNDGKKFSFDLSPLHFSGAMQLLICGDKRTVMVTSAKVAVIHRGAYGEEQNAVFADLKKELTVAFEGEYITFGSEVTSISNSEDEINIASVNSEKQLFVLTKNLTTGLVSMSIVDLETGELSPFDLKKAFDNGAVLAMHGEIVLIAGEAKKGEPYLIAAKLGEIFAGKTFYAEEDMPGKVSFEEQGDSVLLTIGGSKTEIKFSESETEIDNEKTGCLKPDEDSETYDCITVEKK